MDTYSNNNTSTIRMQSLLDTARILNSSLDTDSVLNTLLTTCIDLIPGGDAGAIFLFNEQTGKLDMRAYNGMNDSVKNVSLNPGESMTGTAFIQKKSIFFENNQIVSQYMNTMKLENMNKAIAGGINIESIHSSICCPLMYRDNPIGVLVIDNMNGSAPLTEDDVLFLEDISIQATIALVNAQNLEKEKATNRILKDYTKLIENERNNFRYSLDIHKKFMEMVFKGYKTSDIIDEASKVIGKDIFIIDDLYIIREFSFYDENLKIGLQKFINTITTQLNRNQKMLLIDNFPFPFTVFPIHINDDTHAWLCVLAKTDDLTELNKIAIERTTTIVAMERLKSHELFTMEQAIKGDFVDNLLNNPTDAYVQTLREKYGLQGSGHFIAFSLKFKFENNNQLDHKVYQQLTRRYMNNFYRLMNSILVKTKYQHFTFVKGTSLGIIIDYMSYDFKPFIESTRKNFDTEFNFHSDYFKMDIAYTLGVSQPFSTMTKFKDAYFEIDYLQRLMKKYRKQETFLYYDGLSLWQFLTNSSEEELRKYYNKILKPLESYSGKSKDDFLLTLETYIKSNCNWTYTKDTLHIHGNTLTYRLNRMHSILGLNLDDYHDRLKLQVAFEIKDMLA